MHADPRWCLKQTRKTVTMTSVGQTRWRTLMMSLEKYIGGCKVVPLNILDKCKIKMWIVVAHNQFNYFYWRWATLTTTSHLQEESLSQRTLRAMMTLWERQPNIYTFLLLKYCWFTSLNDCIPKEPAIKGQYRGLVRGRHDDSIDSPMVLLNSELMLFTSFSSPITCCWQGAVYHATHLPWQSGHSDLLKQTPN